MPETTYRLTLDGRAPPPEAVAALQQVEVEDHARLAGMVRLRFGVGVREDGIGWELLDDDLFPRLCPIRVETRIGGDSQVLLDAYVVETHARLANEPGGGSLEVVAMDATVLMDLEEKVRAWPDMADGDIAQQVFGDHGLDAEVDSTQPVRQEADVTTIQRGTDIRFLRALARRNGFECYVETDPASGRAVGHFHPPRLDAPPQGVLTMSMGAVTNVDRLDVRHQMMRPARAAAHALAATTLEPHDASADATALPLLGSTALPDAGDARSVLLVQTDALEPEELQARVQAAADEHAWAVAVEGQLNTASFPGILRAKRPVLLRGAGRRLSGPYHVQRVLHVFNDEGHVQHFTLVRNAVGLRGDEDFTQAVPA